MNVFSHIEGFSVNEKWGLPHKMNGLLIMLLEKVRKLYLESYDPEARLSIHCGYERTGHASNSQHDQPMKNSKGHEMDRIGNASDFHIVSKLSYSKQIEAMILILTDLQVEGIVGLGIYPDWNSPGFHLDVRGFKGRWGRVKGKYISFGDALKVAQEVE